MIDSASIRKITMHKGPTIGHAEVYFVHEKDVDTFITAQEKLHHNPGINPHTGGPTSPLTYLSVEKINHQHDNIYWWATPSLNANCSGATVIGWEIVTQKHYKPEDNPTTPEYLNKIKADTADTPITVG